MKRMLRILDWILEYNTPVIFVLLLVISSQMNVHFFTRENLLNLLRQQAGMGIVSMGMLLVILTGGIDLSVGSVAALSSVLCAQFLHSFGYPFPVAILLTIGMGILAGAVSGFFVANRQLAPFIVTLAMMTVARGLAFLACNGKPILIGDEGSALKYFGGGYIAGIPIPVFTMFTVYVITLIVLRYTVFGRLVTAVGSNETAVRLSGVLVGAHKFAVYCIAGGCAAMAGIISTSRTMVGSPRIGEMMELDAIAAVVVGGATLSGGRGTALNTLLGVLILGMIGNIMNLSSVGTYHQQVIKGIIIVAAVVLQGIQQQRRLKDTQGA